MLGEWWSFYRRAAANSFHLHVDSCFSSLTASSLSMCDIWEFAFDSILKITFMWEHYRPSHAPLKTLQGETMWVDCQRGYIVIQLSVMHPLETLCGSRLVCIFIWTPQTDPYFTMTAKGRPPLSNNSYKTGFNWCNKCSNLFQQHKLLSLVSDKRPWLRSSLPRTSVTTGEWQRVSYSSGLWAQTLHCGYKAAEQSLLNRQLSSIVRVIAMFSVLFVGLYVCLVVGRMSQ